MSFKRYLNAFNVYLIVLIIFSSILISVAPKYQIIIFIIYVFIHFLLIYMGIYYFKFVLYFIYFFTGIIFDIFLLNEIGPHLLIFMILLLTLNKLQKFIKSLSSLKIFIFIIIILFVSLILEMILAQFLFNFSFIISNLLKNILIALIISIPVFYLFNKIDKFG